MDLGLKGKTAVITGGSRGIGRAIGLRLADEGCGVAVGARTSEHVLITAEEIRDRGVSALGVSADLTRPGAVERFVEEAARELGGIDLLVANLGASEGGSLLESTPEEWTRTFDLNVLNAARAIRACAPHMKARDGGAVVIISSISGWKPGPRAQYGAAKAAEIYLAAALARELAPQSIRVNAVSPGSILIAGGGWDRYRSSEPERFREFEQRDFPAGRLGTAQEVADVVAFLLSDRARWINGANICVDGAQGRPSASGW